jgi:hypothetical protein
VATALFERSRPDVHDGSRWWSTYHGTARVIFGHDAVRGRVRVMRDGLPQVIGLDSGCVYGGFLSGYLIESDEVVSVRAKKVYCAVR